MRRSGSPALDVTDARPAHPPSDWVERDQAAACRVGRVMTLPARSVLVFSVAAVCCGGDPLALPAPEPTPPQEAAYVFTVMCANCPGLTNVEIDRSVMPHRARLAVGRLTSLRAAAIDGCRDSQAALDIARWTVSDPSVIRVEPTSPESAKVTALAPGVVSVTADRRLPDGTLSRLRLRDGFAPLPPTLCSSLPGLLVEVVP